MFSLFKIFKRLQNYFVTRFSNTGSALLTPAELAVLQAAKANVEAISIADNTSVFIFYVSKIVG